MDADLARDSVRDAARVIVLAAQHLAPGPSVVEIATEEVRVTIRLVGRDPPPQPPPKPLTPCESDILALLAEAPMPWVTRRVLDEMAKAGMGHGESTIRHALARLSGAGLVINRRGPPRGYHLPSAANIRSHIAS